ncbi:hypothetical protein D3C72_2486970 [compost metagenome]
MHQPHAFTAAEKGTGEVDADDPLPVLVGSLDKGIDRADAGIVDQDIETTEARLYSGHGHGH